MFLLLALALAQDKDVQVENEWKGTDSRIEALEFQRCCSREEWGKLWERHAGKGSQIPKVDFDKSMIVAAFFGIRGGMKWAPTVEGVKAGKDGISAEVLGKIETNPVELLYYRPYIILQVPRSNGKLSIRALFAPYVKPEARAEIGKKEFDATAK